MNKISIFSQDFEPHLNNPNISFFREEWNLPRKKTLEYTSELSGGEAAEEAFRLLNIPPEELQPEERKKIEGFRGPSLSVGDIVEITTPTETTQLLCAQTGWLSKTVEKTPEPETPTEETPTEETPTEETPTEETPKISLHKETLLIEVNLYRSGQTALQLVCEDGTPYANPSVNLPEEEAAYNTVFIKNYSENEGVTDSLIQAGIGKKTGEILLPPYGAEVAVLEITHPKLLEKIEGLRNTLKDKANPKAQPKANTPNPEIPSL